MAVSKHTPGPWEVRFRFGRLTTVSGRQRYPICDTGTAPLGEANHGREEANARLIAAAPAMLEALREMTVLASHIVGPKSDECSRGKLERALAAIAKATGSSDFHITERRA